MKIFHQIKLNFITCPTNILAAAVSDSVADVPMVTCITHAILAMMNCITPRWYSTEMIQLKNTTTGST